MKPNLLVTYEPAHAGSAEQELASVVKEKPIMENGMAKLTVKDPKKLVAGLKKKKFEYLFRWIPVDQWVKTDLKIVQGAIKKLVPQIDDKEKWKLALTKRSWDEKDLVIKLTEPVNKPNVDLNKPDKIIAVEVLGKETAVSLLNKDELKQN
jgi:tRNA(Ser,Leu) C12 N-acetylase TAN1